MDLFIFNWLYNNFAHKSGLLNSVIFVWAELLLYIFALGIWIWFIVKNRSKQTIILGLVAIFAALVSRFVIVNAIYFFIERTRPFAELNLLPVFSHDAYQSFPSGHAAFFFALITAMFILSRKAGLLFSFVAIGMVITRVVAGVHWPSDVLVGALEGLITGNFITILYVYRYSFK